MGDERQQAVVARWADIEAHFSSSLEEVLFDDGADEVVAWVASRPGLPQGPSTLPADFPPVRVEVVDVSDESM